ncbi:MAG: Ig-like domain-containing protein [Prolixibacteraceae bacterium]|nr:Ig-like domain-containing protein [Prolixibacteraceae bacterium]
MKIPAAKKISGVVFFLGFLGGIVSMTVLSTSCANQGQGPSGGPRDTIPPVVVLSEPAPFETNYTSNHFEISFDEYISADNMNEKLVISPPLEKKPDVSIRGKSVIVKLDEELLPNRTYAFDFQDAIKDYNEGNKIESLRLVFSTSEMIDTLRISGYVLDAQNLSPQASVTVTLYNRLNDSLFTTTRPDFIAKTNEKGYYLFNNLPAGEYRLFALTDEDKNLYFSQKTEQIAFADSVLKPEATFINQPDTLISGKDTIVSAGYTEFSPEEQYMVLFLEAFYDQYLISSSRPENDRCLLVFNEPLSDSFRVDVLPPDVAKYPKQLVPGENQIPHYTEFGHRRDSVMLWITDSLAATIDTLTLAATYFITDTLGQPVATSDTLSLVFKGDDKKRIAPRDTLQDVKNTFDFKSNLSRKNFDLNKNIILEATSPLAAFETEKIKLEKAITDSTYETIAFERIENAGKKRLVNLDYKPESETTYRLTIDSGAVKTLTGFHNLAVEEVFTTRAADYYGSIFLNIKGISNPAIILLLKSAKDEPLVEKSVMQPGEENVVLDYLNPGKYLIKLIVDRNGNGEWDTGNYEEGMQPERIYYFNKEIEVKSNWEIKENWEINPDIILPKEVNKAGDEKKK